MSGSGFELGHSVSFPGGEGQVVGTNSYGQKDLLKIQTTPEQILIIPSDLACIKCL